MPLAGFVPYDPKDAATYNKYRWWLGITFGDMLDKAADIFPDKEAVVDSNTRLTYGQVREKADRLAIALMELGIKPGDRVMIQMPNWAEFIYSYFAVQKIGAIAVLVIAQYRQVEVNHLAKLTGATAWIVPEKYRSQDYIPIIADARKASPGLKHIITVRSKGLEGCLSLEKLIDGAKVTKASLAKLAACRPDPGEVAHMGPTGGTTGLPKVAPCTHNSYIARIEYVARALDYHNNDTVLVAAPIGHDLGFSHGLMPTIFAMGKVVMQDSTEPADIAKIVQAEKITAAAWLPTLADRLVNLPNLKDFDVSSLQKMYCGAQPSTPTLIKLINDKMHCKYVCGYGGTEGMRAMTGLNDDPATIHLTVGKPVCPYDIYKIIDNEDGRDLGYDKVGELAVKGPLVFTGYFHADEENAKAFTKDGFFKTGDQAVIESSGKVRLTGRIKDIIRRGGENISPIEIENLVVQHPDVVACSVVGMPDPTLGERTCAYVQAKPGAKPTLEIIVAFLRAKGASVLQLPERVELIEIMPTTAAGKPDKKPLREDIKNKVAAGK